MSREERAYAKLMRIPAFLEEQDRCPAPFQMTLAERADHVRALAEQAYQIVSGEEPEGGHEE